MLGFPPLHIRDAFERFITENAISKSLFGTNRSILLNRAVCRKIIEYYNGDTGHQTDLKTGNLGYGLFHYSLILNLKPKRVLCVGSRKGFIPAMCALACQEHGAGHVDFVDAGYGPHDRNHWTGIGWWKQTDPSKHFSYLDLTPWITTHIMTTAEFARKTHAKYHYIYIDGDHSYVGVKKDYRLFWPRLEKGGFMAFHDIFERGKHPEGIYGVARLWHELTRKKTSTILPGTSGLGILQKI